MKKAHPLFNSRLDGGRVLLPFGVLSFGLSLVFAVTMALHWPRALRAAGVIGVMSSPMLLGIASWDLWRYRRGWRIILAALLALIATVINCVTTILFANGRF